MKEFSIRTITSVTVCVSQVYLHTTRLACTSGCPLEIWFDQSWIAGYVEGDGENYWLFATTGGKFLLAERMKARYTGNRLGIQ
jgi:hypothetical protein